MARKGKTSVGKLPVLKDGASLMCHSMPLGSELDMSRYAQDAQKLYKCRDYQTAFTNCDKFLKDNMFLSTVSKINGSFYDYGFRLVPEKESVKFEEWELNNAIPLLNLRRAIWSNLQTKDNCVVFWRDESSIPALTLKLDRCSYADDLGYSILKYRPQMTDQQLALIRSKDSELADRYKQGEIIVGYTKNPNGLGYALIEVPEEHYLVIKHGEVGDGFTWPSLVAATSVLAQCDSMEAGEAVLAFAMRTVVRLQKIGHEIKAGNFAGYPNYHAKKPRLQAAIAVVKGKVGMVDAAVNFDHSFEFITPDTKGFDPAKWESIEKRLGWWLGPVAWMISLQGTNPFLMSMLKSTAIAERDLVRPYLEQVINKAFKPPVNVEVKWSNRCFQNEQIAGDLLKFGQQIGMLGSRSIIEGIGYDPDEEMEQKKKDLALEKETKGILKPIYDAAHGPEDPKTATKKGGRPEGSPDPQNQT